jgi:uncharacterized phage infection (PIP) family protein YhgE
MCGDRGMCSRTASILLLLPALGMTLGAQKGDFLSEDEVDQIRETQDPSQRLELYLSFAQVRLERIDDYRTRAPDPDYDIASYLDQQIDQYIRITDELKNWVQEQYDHHADMRAGLEKFLEVGPHQLEQLRHIEQTPGPYLADYRKSLSDAIDDFTDAVDGATKALSDQSKQFGELKREEKAEAQAAKEREKEEKKRAKDEKKLRKKEHEKGIPGAKDED